MNEIQPPYIGYCVDCGAKHEVGADLTPGERGCMCGGRIRPRDEWTTARKRPVEVEYRGPYTTPDKIDTLEGAFGVDEGYISDHDGFVIIRGAQGEVYPCALDIFEQTYRTETDSAPDHYPRRFELVRTEDVSETSGEGVVAVGVAYPDGAVHMQWRNAENDDLETDSNGVAFKPAPDGVEATEEIHGHGGRTEIRWID